MKFTIKVVLAVGLGLYLGTALSAQEYSTEYRIGPQDLLEISVLGTTEFDKLQVRVSEDGRVTLPLLGPVEVNNLTKAELEERLAKLLDEKYLLNPQVTVFIQEYRSKTVSVLGAVESPGTFELLGRLTLLDIISKAGGLNREAANEIIIIRKLPGNESTALHISIEELFFKGDAKLNIPLEAGDVINVPIDKMVNVYIWGQVKNPGVLQVKMSNIPTLTQAIAQAGGFTERARKSKVRITRKGSGGQEQEIIVNVKQIQRGKIKDVQLMENDTVHVSETIF